MISLESITKEFESGVFAVRDVLKIGGKMFTARELEDAARLVHTQMAPTPQYAWPLLSSRAGATVWVKHENHTPATLSCAGYWSIARNACWDRSVRTAI